MFVTTNFPWHVRVAGGTPIPLGLTLWVPAAPCPPCLCHMSVQRVSKGYPMGREAPFPRRRLWTAGAFRAACPKAPRDAKSSFSFTEVAVSYARARYKIRCADKKSGFFEFLLGKVWRVGKVGVPLQPQTCADRVLFGVGKQTYFIWAFIDACFGSLKSGKFCVNRDKMFQWLPVAYVFSQAFLSTLVHIDTGYVVILVV